MTNPVAPERVTLAGRSLPVMALFWTVLVAGLVMRALWALLVPIEPSSDAVAYQTFALNILEHGTYGWEPGEPTAYWAVGTSAMLAGIYWLFGVDFGAVAAVQVLLSTGLIAQVFWLGRHWIDARAGLIAAALVAFWPSLIMYVTVIASDANVLFFVFGGAVAFEARWRRRWLGLLVAGLFWAAAVYIRPIALLVPPVLAFAALVRSDWSLGRAAGHTAAVLALILLAVAPWSVRNYQVFDRPVLVSTNLGANLWMGNHPGSSGTYNRLPAWTKEMDEAERDAALRAEALAYIREEPGAFLARTGYKLAALHARETIAVVWNEAALARMIGATGVTALKLLATGYWYLVLAAGLAGAVVLARRRGLFGALFHPTVLLWGYFAAVHAIIVIGDRYHFPSIPVIAMLAGLALGALADRAGRQA